MEGESSQKLNSNRPQNGKNRPIRDVRESLQPEELEIYNKFTHGREHTLATVRQARNKEAILKALKETKGYVQKACDMVGISRRTYYSYMDDPLFAEMVMEIREAQVDFAEDKLLNNVERGFEASIIFYLKTQGRRRGYSEGQVPGSFQGTQEEYYQNRFRDLDDTQLLDEIKTLRERLKLSNDVSIGGFDGAELMNEQEFLEESQVVDLETNNKPKDIIINPDEVTVPKKEMVEGILTAENLTPEQRLDMLLKEFTGMSTKESAEEDYKNKHIIHDKNDFRNLITDEPSQ